MMRKLGIFLAYAPEQSLSEHGLGRLLAMLIRGMTQREVSLVLGMPHWCVREVRKVLTDLDVDTRNVEWLTTPKDPVLLRMHRSLLAWQRRRMRTRRTGFLRALIGSAKSVAAQIGSVFEAGLATNSIVLFALTISLIAVLPLAMAWYFARHAPMPFAAVIVIALLGVPVVRNRRLRVALLSRLSRVRRSAARIFRPAREFKGVTLAQRMYARMRDQEMGRLLARINRREDIEAWLIPTIFWPEAGGIKAPKTVVVPDLVMIDAPVQFADHASLRGFEDLRKSVMGADRLICYSEHVRQTHLIRRFGIDESKVSVIEHAPVDTREPFRRPLYCSIPVAEAGAHILREFFRGGAGSRQLRGVDLTEVPFLFYASQIRPHKNILTLIKAYEMLLRRDLVDVKLVLTGDLFAPEASDLASYVHDRRLQYDVISLPRVPSRVLSALFACSHLAVCPTLFEGGLPFTFTEALNVDTPVIMSRIPVVIEKVTDPRLAAAMLFDPYDAGDLCARMRWALDNRQSLLAMQRPLFAELSKRTWDDVAADYIEVMRSTRRTPVTA
jgi:glycosyltransferase involved in cell wall biosynthesis